MICSTIIPTIGRDSLSRAVQSIVDQSGLAEQSEIIVVNDSGMPLPRAAWMSLPFVRVIDTNRRRLSVARNTGAAVARGQYLLFLDDDDWMMSNALCDLLTALEGQPISALAYGGVCFVDELGSTIGHVHLRRNGNCFTQLVGGAWIPSLAAMYRAEAFFRVGGYDPEYGPGEEEDLNRRLALTSDFVSTESDIANALRGHGWRTTVDYNRSVKLDRQSRERVLSMVGSFDRLIASADSDYWRGRVMRIYGASARWNMMHRNYTVATHRLVQAARSLSAFPTAMRSIDYWHGARDLRVPQSSERAFATAHG